VRISPPHFRDGTWQHERPGQIEQDGGMMRAQQSQGEQNREDCPCADSEVHGCVCRFLLFRLKKLNGHHLRQVDSLRTRPLDNVEDTKIGQ
jgi:hypothetical protein